MIVPIRQYPDPILRKKTIKVKPYHDIRQLAQNLKDTALHNNGIGLAANQIGSLLSVIYANDCIYVNPEIVERSETGGVDIEECLSIPNYRKWVWRYDSVVIKSLDEHKKPIKTTHYGWGARVIQHELDHCNGRLLMNGGQNV